MKTSEDIAIEVRKVLRADKRTRGFDIVRNRTNYGKSEQIVIVPHYTTGWGSIRTAYVKVRFHCPDIQSAEGMEENSKRLADVQKILADVLEYRCVKGTGITWKVSAFDQSQKEQNYNEHFITLTIEACIREK